MTIQHVDATVERAPSQAPAEVGEMGGPGTGVTREEANRLWQVARMVSNTALVPKPLQNKPEVTMGVFLHLSALGIPCSLVGLKQVHVWEDRGTVQMQLHYQAHIALMARAGHDGWISELTGDSATFTIVRGDTGREQSFTYTMDMARKAGLTNKDNWQKHPHYMLPARAAVMAARFACPDALIGLEAYVADEPVKVQPTEVDKIPADPSPRAEGHAALQAGVVQSEVPAASSAPPPRRPGLIGGPEEPDPITPPAQTPAQTAQAEHDWNLPPEPDGTLL